MTASKNRSSALAQATAHAVEAIEAYSVAFPDATYYEIKTELEAAQILLTMAAMIKHTQHSITSQDDRNAYRAVANSYRAAVNQGRALATFANMTEEDQLELYGLKLVARRRLKPENLPSEPPKIVTKH